jgi:hypothetical protein
LLFENFFYFGFCCADGGEELLNVFKMIVAVEGEATGLAEELGHEGGGTLFGAAALGALTLADGDHDIAELGDLENRLDHVSLVAGEAAVLEGVEVALGGAGAGAAATPSALQPGGRRLGQAEDAAAFGELLR